MSVQFLFACVWYVSTNKKKNNKTKVEYVNLILSFY